MRKTTRFLPIAILIVALVALVGATAAVAHVKVKKTTPAKGKAIKAAKAKNAVVVFNGALRKGTLKVFVRKPNGKNGKKVSKGNGARDPRNNKRIVTTLNKGLKPGNYIARWTVVGADGHKQNGSFRFKIVK